MDADALFVEFFHLSNLWGSLGRVRRRQNAILFTPKSSFLVVPPSCSMSQRLQAAWRETCAKPPTLAPLAQPPADCTLQMVSLYEVRKEQQCVVRCSVKEVVGVRGGVLVVRVTDGTGECEVEVEEAYVTLFEGMQSLEALVRVLGGGEE